jgi:hypothetical protein
MENSHPWLFHRSLYPLAAGLANFIDIFPVMF